MGFKMEKYEEFNMEIVVFEMQDVVRASSDAETEPMIPVNKEA